MIKFQEITSRTVLLTAGIGSLLVMVLVTANSLWAARQAATATDEAVSAVSAFYLETMAEQRAGTVTKQINNDFIKMEKALQFIEDEGVESQEELRDTIGKVQDLLSLSGFALVDEDDVVYTQYTTYTGGSRHEFLSEENTDERVISTVSLYGSSKLLCLAIPTPDLTIMGKPFKACFIQIDIKDIVNLLAFDSQGKTFFAVYSNKGGNLSGTELGPVISTHNFLEATKSLVPEAVWKTHVDNFAREARGDMMFSCDGVEETLSYVPIHGTGWELAVLIYESVIHDQFRGISTKSINTSRSQVFFTLTVVLILSIVLLLELGALSKRKLEAEKKTSQTFFTMANTDSLTGVRNKHAYSELGTNLSEKIQNNEIDRLAVVVCDINGLKYVNDTQGHAAGDQLIKDACSLICEYFAHGAVFRVGGDEFAVILQGKGFETMDEVMAAFNQRVEENIRENGAVVSIGYSVLEQGDQQLSDVFERADQMMYKRKEELKAMGAKTR